MKKVFFATFLLILAGIILPVSAEPSFEQVSEHCYVLHMDANDENIAIIVTDQGSVLFDPPPEPDLSVLVDSLKNQTGGPVRWMLSTGFSYLHPESVEYFAGQGAVLVAGFRQSPPPVPEPEPYPISSPAFPPAENAKPVYDPYGDPNGHLFDFPGQRPGDSTYPGIHQDETPSYTQFIFKQDMYLYPSDLEIKIQELQQPAVTKADIYTYVPFEKVLLVGRLFEPYYYPDIDVDAGGSALQWIDSLEQVINSVPLLISAIPPEEPEEEEEMEDGQKAEEEETSPGEGEPEEEEEEKTLEEMITVVSARGEMSNLQMMKDMLETSKNLRKGVERTVKAGRSCERYLESSQADPYRIYGNFFPFAGQLCKELSPQEEENEEGAGSQ